jgi:hypothetical protein
MRKDDDDKPTHDPAEPCKCGDEPSEPPHVCPFAEEIYGDTETLCTCCEKCQHECAMDV